MQTETPNANPTQDSTFIDRVLEIVTADYFQKMDDNFKNQFYARFREDFEWWMQSNYNRGFFEGQMKVYNETINSLKESNK
jgi:hypothetical protein